MKTTTNKVQLMGHLGQEPIVKTFEGGSCMATFTLATNESYTNSVGTRIDNTQWHRLVAWGDQALRVSDQLHKGMKVIVEGKLNYRNYEGKDGVKRYVTEILLYDFIEQTNLSEKTESISEKIAA